MTTELRHRLLNLWKRRGRADIGGAPPPTTGFGTNPFGQTAFGD